MNILLINHYAGSPTMGMEYRPYYLAKEWIKLGHQVTIVAANNSHIRKQNKEMSTRVYEEIIDGITYFWIKTPQYSGNGIGRIKNIYTFVKQLFKRANYIIDSYKPDVVIASSTYPSDNYPARKIARLAKAKYVYEVHDLWPLSPMELGGMSKYHPFIMLMQHGENFAYKNADAVISMLPKTQEHMQNHGLDLSKWSYIPNGFDITEWENKEELNSVTKDKIAEIKQEYDYIIAYTGTIGLANAIDTLILASEKVKNESVAVLVVGKGPEKKNLQNLVKQKHISNVFFLESITKQEVPNLLDLCDTLYIGLQYQPLFKFGISPNKLIDYMMAGKPIIQGIDAGNNVVKEVGCGLDIEPENPDAVVDAILTLKNMPKMDLVKMGQNGRKFVLENHDYRILAKKFISVIEKLNF